MLPPIKLNWLKYNKIYTLIENIWNLHKNHPYPRNSRPKGKNQVKIAVLKEGEKITDEDLQKFVDSMSERVQAVTIANRGHTGKHSLFPKKIYIGHPCVLIFVFAIMLPGAVHTKRVQSKVTPRQVHMTVKTLIIVNRQ